jgi:molybdopterin-guanine dinucleotide biosynthesis protein A
MQHSNCTGVILAGGLNMRFGGRNKALVEIGGQTILDRTLSSFEGLFPETMVVTNTPLAYLSCSSLIVTDFFSLRTPLAGLHAALSYANTPYIFAVACDTPFLDPAVIEAVLAQIDTRSDIVVPDAGNGLQPLCAVYAKTCLPPIEKQLREAHKAASPATPENAGGPAKRVLNQGLKILNVYDRVRVKVIGEELLLRLDPDLLSFFNVNTPEDFARAERIFTENKNSRRRYP